MSRDEQCSNFPLNVTDFSVSFIEISDDFVLLFIFNKISFFLVWCRNAGLKFNEMIVDMNEPRFICDKHFSPNYISTQSRRKMLVYTAVPIKCTGAATEPNQNRGIKLVGGSATKKRRLRELNDEELEDVSTVKTVGSPEIAEVESETILTLGRIDDNIKDGEMETFEVEDECEAFRDQDKVEYILTDDTPSPAKPYSGAKRRQSYLSVDLESENEDQPTFKPSDAPLDGYSEFIFSGEKYVQMPKRVFEAEKQKLIDEVDKYKNMLNKIKVFLNKVDC